MPNNYAFNSVPEQKRPGELGYPTSLNETLLWLALLVENELPAYETWLKEFTAQLDENGKLLVSQLPAIAINDVFVVADIAERDALVAETGDIAKVLDSDGLGNINTYILAGDSSWIDIQESANVINVNGKTGSVTLVTDDIEEGAVLYFTPQRAIEAIGGSIDDEGVLATDILSAQKVIELLEGKSDIGHQHSISEIIDIQNAVSAGVIQAINKDGHGLSIGQPVLADGTLANAATMPSSEAIGLVYEIIDADNIKIISNGYLPFSSLAGENNVAIYLQDDGTLNIAEGKILKQIGNRIKTGSLDGIFVNIAVSIGMTEDQPEIPKGGGGYVYLIKDSDYTANKQEHIFVDTSIPNLIMTLPSNPTLGDTVIVADMTGNAITNNVTIGRGNKTIMGLAEDFILDVSSSEVKFTYSNEANGWRVS